MNNFFKRDLAGHAFPESAYGKIDHFELSDDETHVLVALDLIDTVWISQNAPSMADDRAFWFNWKGTAPNSPFDTAPLFRLELELTVHDLVTIFGPESIPAQTKLAAFLPQLLGAWFEFSLSRQPADGHPGLLYFGLFTKPADAYVRGQPAAISMARTLAQIVNLDCFPTIAPADFAAALSMASSHYLAVYDVGQGNSNALLDPDYFPTLYFDLGAGVFRNAGTTPSALNFCFAKQPAIILSHWDADHWAGAFARTAAESDAALALRMRWIAPRQDITVIHFAFALELMKHGWLSIVDRHAPVMPKGDAHRIEYWFGTTPLVEKNGSGIVLNVVESASSNSWLLTGDCDYAHFPSGRQLSPIAIVAPHHGAKIPHPDQIPAPSLNANGYLRLIYSYGPNNRHGRHASPHPKRQAIKEHDSKGWEHTAKSLKAPGYTTGGGKHVRSTASHPPGRKRQDLLIGWAMPTSAAVPAPRNRPALRRLRCV